MKLSERKDFASAIVWTADYAANPGSNGECEFAIRQLKTKTEIWMWVEDFGSDCVVELPRDSGWRDWVSAMVSNDRFMSPIWPPDVVWYRVSDPIGELLAWSCCADEDILVAIPLILKFDDDTIKKLGGNWEYALKCAARVYGRMLEECIDLDDVPGNLHLDRPTGYGLEFHLTDLLHLEARNS